MTKDTKHEGRAADKPIRLAEVRKAHPDQLERLEGHRMAHAFTPPASPAVSAAGELAAHDAESRALEAEKARRRREGEEHAHGRRAAGVAELPAAVAFAELDRMLRELEARVLERIANSQPDRVRDDVATLEARIGALEARVSELEAAAKVDRLEVKWVAETEARIVELEAAVAHKRSK